MANPEKKLVTQFTVLVRMASLPKTHKKDMLEFREVNVFVCIVQEIKRHKLTVLETRFFHATVVGGIAVLIYSTSSSFQLSDFVDCSSKPAVLILNSHKSEQTVCFMFLLKPCLGLLQVSHWIVKEKKKETKCVVSFLFANPQ